MNNIYKGLLTAFLVITCIFSLLLNASALDTSVDFGNAEGYIFNPTNKDLFADFKEIMPGDVKQQTVALKNTGSDATSTIYMKSEVEEADKEFLKWMTLDIYLSDKNGGKDSLIASSPASEEGELINWTKLCMLNPGETKYITVVLKVDSRMNNQQALKRGVIHWEFQMEEGDTAATVTEPSTSKQSVTRVEGNSTVNVNIDEPDTPDFSFVIKNEGTTKVVKLPYTGSDSDNLIIVCLSAILLSATAVTVVSIKKKEEGQKT